MAGSRGLILARFRNIGNILNFSDKEIEQAYYRMGMNSNTHTAGATIAQGEMISTSLKLMERSSRISSGKVGNARFNGAEIRQIMEEYKNLASATR